MCSLYLHKTEYITIKTYNKTRRQINVQLIGYGCNKTTITITTRADDVIANVIIDGHNNLC